MCAIAHGCFFYAIFSNQKCGNFVQLSCDISAPETFLLEKHTSAVATTLYRLVWNDKVASCLLAAKDF